MASPNAPSVTVPGQGSPADPKSIFILARLVEHGQGGHQKDEMKAFQLYKQAAEAGHVDAQKKLSKCFSKGMGTVEKNDKLASTWMRKAANTKDLGALLAMGEFYAEGRGVIQSDVDAAKFFRSAADTDNGNPEAMYRLAKCYEAGKGVVQSDKNAFAYFVRAARSPRGHAGAFCALGAIYNTGNSAQEANLDEAVKWYMRALEHNHPEAFFFLAQAHEHGRGVVQDNAKALELYNKAAEKSHVKAMRYLGWLYEQGTSITDKNLELAIYWYQKAANKKDPDALNNLGLCYARGFGCEKSGKTAISLFQKAAALDHVLAMRNLALLYEHGIDSFDSSVQPNMTFAQTWYTKAAALGDDISMKWLASLGRSTNLTEHPAPSTNVTERPARSTNVTEQRASPLTMEPNGDSPPHYEPLVRQTISTSVKRADPPDAATNVFVAATIDCNLREPHPAQSSHSPGGSGAVKARRSEFQLETLSDATSGPETALGAIQVAQSRAAPPSAPHNDNGWRVVDVFTSATVIPPSVPAERELPTASLSGRPGTWSVDQVSVWLQREGLSTLVPLFRSHHISGAALIHLTEKLITLMDPQMPVGYLAILLASVNKVKEADNLAAGQAMASADEEGSPITTSAGASPTRMSGLATVAEPPTAPAPATVTDATTTQTCVCS